MSVFFFPPRCLNGGLEKRSRQRRKEDCSLGWRERNEQIKQRGPVPAARKQRSSLFFTRDFLLRHLVTYEEEQVTFRKVNVEEKTPFLQIRIVRCPFTQPRCLFFSIWFVDGVRQRKRREGATKKKKKKENMKGKRTKDKRTFDISKSR